MECRLLSDKVLVKLLKADNETAFKEVYNRYWNPLYKKTYNKIRRHDIAEEIVQNVFVKLWEKRTTSAILHLENYLQTAVKYQVINHFKSLLIKEKYINSLKEKNFETEDAAATKFLVDDLNLIINKAIHELPEKTQMIFNLSRSENYSVKQISESMHLSEKAVEYHITKSLARLRLHLKEIVSLMIVVILTSFFY